ncbi:hypothetical protein [Azospirillum argentinense]
MDWRQGRPRRTPHARNGCAVVRSSSREGDRDIGMRAVRSSPVVKPRGQAPSQRWPLSVSHSTATSRRGQRRSSSGRTVKPGAGRSRVAGCDGEGGWGCVAVRRVMAVTRVGGSFAPL